MKPEQLDILQAEVDDIKRLQAENAAEFGPILPAKLLDGRLDRQFHGWAKNDVVLRPVLEKSLGAGIFVPEPKPRTKSLLASLKVPTVDYRKPFEEQRQASGVAIKNCMRLLPNHVGNPMKTVASTLQPTFNK